ncbi:DUF1127 domain-containing protein [Rhodobacterales bacterium HKCCE2091]|nr:DUF1127 domain-containing protein [Rhodobacterales bacterium HKCCE2091]
MFAASRQRAALGQLDAHSLRDIGISAQEAQSEIARPFWQVPGHWLR